MNRAIALDGALLILGMDRLCSGRGLLLTGRGPAGPVNVLVQFSVCARFRLMDREEGLSATAQEGDQVVL